MDTLYFLFVERPYGAMVVGLSLWLALRPWRRRFRRPWHLYAGLAVALAGGGLLPSMPRYAYEDRIREMVAYSPHMVERAVRRQRFLLEPLTWINPPATAFTYAGPLAPFAPDDSVRRFQVDRYSRHLGHKPRRLTIDCDAGTMTRQVTDRAGRFFPDGRGDVPLRAEMRAFYCTRSWRAEVTALEGGTP